MSKLWLQNVDVLSHVTWVFLEFFGLSWRGVDKMSQWCGNLSVIGPAIIKCHTPLCMNEDCLNDEYVILHASLCLIYCIFSLELLFERVSTFSQECYESV
jgi:hypothetical protein